MKNEAIINKTIQLYFSGGDWQGYIKQEVRRRKSLQADIQHMFRGWMRDRVRSERELQKLRQV